MISTDSRFSKNAAGSLEITNIKKSDAGLYKCIATNKLGSDERVGELKVNGKNAIAYCYHFVFKGDAHLSSHNIVYNIGPTNSYLIPAL